VINGKKSIHGCVPKRTFFLPLQTLPQVDRSASPPSAVVTPQIVYAAFRVAPDLRVSCSQLVCLPILSRSGCPPGAADGYSSL